MRGVRHHFAPDGGPRVEEFFGHGQARETVPLGFRMRSLGGGVARDVALPVRRRLRCSERRLPRRESRARRANQGDGSFIVTYTINTNGLDTRGGSFTGLNQIGFLAIKDWTSVSLISAPNGVGNWTDPIEAVIHSNALCTPSNGHSDKVCSSTKSNFLDMSGGGDFVWKFRVVGGTELDTDEWHFSGQWTNRLGADQGQIISVGAGGPTPPAVPEPTAALLFGVGTLVVGGSLRHPARRIA